MTPRNFEWLAALLRNGSGLVIGPDKLYLLETRLAPMLRANRLADLDALALKLRAGAPALQRDVIEAMTTNESSFFRDDKPFVHARTQALPRLHAARPPGARLRVWSAAASTGQEAYSLAMILAEDRAKFGTREVEIVGTDLAREPLARARQGVYTQFEVQRGLPVQMLLKYFRKDEGNWRIADSIRGMASFREWNLLGDLRPLGTFDLVFCRNVLIYFDPATKARALEAIARQMAPDALLYLGGAETVLGVTDRFAPVPGDRGVYALNGAAPAAPPNVMPAAALSAARPLAGAASR
jgi:chemotaxis protein methyltransferase CheR